MSVQAMLLLVYFIAFIVNFCYVETLPFSSKRIKYAVVGCTAAVIIVNILADLMIPDISLVELSRLTMTVPSVLLCWACAKHRDLRFVFVYCSLDTIGFILSLCTFALSDAFHLNALWTGTIGILLMMPVVYGFYRYGMRIRKILDLVRNSWGILTLFVLVIYSYSYYLAIYPAPWVGRTEYVPVIMSYIVLIILSYIIIFGMLVSIVKINELEEKKNRMMINKIRPHFIYNVLLSIRYFTKKEPDVAYDLIYDFANYLRSNMESLENKKYISWNEELQHIRAYAGIEQKRYGEKLHVIYEVEEAAFKIPPLTIEPLVENAIKHGVGVREEGGTVWIRGHRTGVGYLIEIEDDGVGFNTDALEEKMDVGLNYIRDQLRAMPGTELHIESSPGNGTKVSIEIGVMINEDDTG
jgi:hypothetical protein